MAYGILRDSVTSGSAKNRLSLVTMAAWKGRGRESERERERERERDRQKVREKLQERKKKKVNSKITNNLLFHDIVISISDIHILAFPLYFFLFRVPDFSTISEFTEIAINVFMFVF